MKRIPVNSICYRHRQDGAVESIQRETIGLTRAVPHCTGIGRPEFACKGSRSSSSRVVTTIEFCINLFMAGRLRGQRLAVPLALHGRRAPDRVAFRRKKKEPKECLAIRSHDWLRAYSRR